jgi:hypothetical protein
MQEAGHGSENDCRKYRKYRKLPITAEKLCALAAVARWPKGSTKPCPQCDATLQHDGLECTPKVRQIKPGQFLRGGTDEATIERNS